MKIVFAALLLLSLSGIAQAKDVGQWDDVTPAIKEWYKGLMMPDSPGVSCCGETDSYWADSFEIAGGNFYAIITDERPDEPLKRKHRNVGTRIIIPKGKIINSLKQQNPTGHGIVFLGPGVNNVYCYVMPGGV
jgi:hypothetical protein